MTMGALLGIAGMAEPDPERVRRFIETAPPLPKHLLRAYHEGAGIDEQGPSTTKVCPQTYGHDPQSGSR